MIQIGDNCPSFKLKNQFGEEFDLANLLGNKTLVIYFYPKDETKVCTAQACSFRDNYEEFKDLGAEIIGISADSVQSHVKFKSKFNLPFILLSDNDKKLRKLFGVANDFLIVPGRQTFVVDQHGTIILVFNNMSGNIHIEKALKVLKKTQSAS